MNDAATKTAAAAAKKKTAPKGKKSRTSYYGLQLREKQDLKRFYGISESQFRKCYEKAAHSSGNTGDMLFQFLERRLDNVIYRSGFAATRRQARQLVSHCFFEVNGHTCNIPSFQVKTGDKIVLRENKRKKGIVEINLEKIEYAVPQWIEKQDDFHATIVNLPLRDDVNDIEVKVQLIIELYSR